MSYLDAALAIWAGCEATEPAQVPESEVMCTQSTLSAPSLDPRTKPPEFEPCLQLRELPDWPVEVVEGQSPATAGDPGPRDVRRGDRWLLWHRERFGPPTLPVGWVAPSIEQGCIGRRRERAPDKQGQVGEFDPGELDSDGKFSIDQFFARLREKHRPCEWVPCPPRPEPDRAAVAAKGDELRAAGKALPLCWLPGDERP
jgi:hypothetical protein